MVSRGEKNTSNQSRFIDICVQLDCLHKTQLDDLVQACKEFICQCKTGE